MPNHPAAAAAAAPSVSCSPCLYAPGQGCTNTVFYDAAPLRSPFLAAGIGIFLNSLYGKFAEREEKSGGKCSYSGHGYAIASAGGACRYSGGLSHLPQPIGVCR